MTNKINQQNCSIPAYSGITINITSPTLNAAPLSTNCSHNCAHNYPTQANFAVENPQNTANRLTNPTTYGMSSPVENNPENSAKEPLTLNETSPLNQDFGLVQSPETLLSRDAQVNTKEAFPQAYPPQYYLNNYNYIQNGEKNNKPDIATASPTTAPNTQEAVNDSAQSNVSASAPQEEDLSSSQEIINDLNRQVAEQKDLEKNGSKTRVVALTNEYIMSLENYLNNPNSEIRLMAAKEILTRLDEDKDRFDDAALNALLNKMLQDPNKLVRIAALSALSSQLASGNNYTVQLLNKIQANPNADKEDVIQAANILLKMSSTTEVKYVPAKKKETSGGNKELEASQKQVEQLRGQLQQYKEKEIAQMLQIPPQGK